MLGALGLEAAVEVVCAVLEQVAGFVALDLDGEGVEFFLEDGEEVGA